MSTNNYAKNTDCRFYPVQCSEATLEMMQPEEGYLYFTTDTRKIFLGKSNKYIRMCANAELFYGHKTVIYENTGLTPNPYVNFAFEDVDDSDALAENDLILNIGTNENPDGCFYRVIGFEDGDIATMRLTMRGSGGGGGGGGGDTPDVPGTPSFTVTEYYPSGIIYATTATEKVDIGMKMNSSEATNLIIRAECSFSKDENNENEKFLIDENLAYPMQSFYYMDLTPYLNTIRDRQDKDQNTIVHMHVYDMYGTVRTKSFTIKVIELNMVSSESAMLSENTGVCRYRMVPSGYNKLASYSVVFDYYDINNTLAYQHVEPIKSSQFNSEVIFDLPQQSLKHGSYTMKAYVQGSMNTVKLNSNVLSYTMIHFDPANGDPILGIVLPAKIEQYAEFPISYLLEYGNSIKPFNLDIRLNDKLIAQESVISGQLSNYYLTIENMGEYTLTFDIESLRISRTYNINVTGYTGVLPVIDTNDVTLMTYLSPRGRTNNSLDRDYWPNSKNESQKATLSNFYFREINGWLKDENGVDYLKVSQGASLDYTAQSPLDNNPDENGLAIELDFKLSGVYDYNEPFIECVSRYNDGRIKTGFIVDGNSFNYYVDGEIASSLNLVTEQRIRISQIVDPSQRLCLTYLNGIISKLITYEESDNKFGNNTRRPAYLSIKSNGGQAHIYGIRFYSVNLSTPKVLRNYQASLDTLELRESNYKENDIFTDAGIIDVDLLNDNGYDWDIPYVKIVGGYAIIKDEDTGDMIMAPAAGNETKLPTGKKDYRAINIEMHYPKYDPATGKNQYFKDYNDFSFVSEFGDSGLDVTNAFDKVMTKGAWMYAQGTSSMVYPVKNLRVKTTGGLKFTVQPDIDPVKLVCFKADYMESSGSHNTGAANYIDNIVYKFSGLKTPGQRQFSDKTIVSCIKGHPCVIFWSPTGEKGTFQFIGKYNFNLDKGTHEPFGFMEDKNDPTFGKLTDEEGNLVLDNNGKPQNSIYCFEFLDNNEKVCNFEHDIYSTYVGYDATTHESGMTYETNDKTEAERYYDTWYSLRRNEEGKIMTGWQLGFESRYPEDKTGDHDADVLREFASWVNDAYALEQTDGRAAAVKKFKDEYWKYLDENFTIAYYVITDALLMMDSRVKNMMIATWGKEWRYLLNDGSIVSQKPEDESKIKDSHFGFIWYPIFYDMDTMLGLNNIGDRVFDYYDDDSRKIYNGDTILWYFVKDALPEKIKEYYQLLESKSVMSKEMILPCFNNNQGNLANEAFYNEDAKYKYISPYLLNHSGVKLPAAQGDRSLDREYFISNRLNYLNGKYSTISHQEVDCLEYRMTYPKKVDNPTAEEDIRLNKSLLAVPPSGKFDLTSIRTCYAGVKVGATFANKKFNGEETAQIELDVTSADGTETYITGISNLAGVGSLADKYPYGFNFNGLAGCPLRQLILGSHNKDYYNPNLKKTASLDLSMLSYLEEFNMENCDTFTGSLNFAAKNPVYDESGNLVIAGTTGCSTIKTINVLGSGVTSISLPSGGIIEELRLSDSIPSLKMDSFVELTDDKFTFGYFDYDTNEYVNNFLKLANLYIKDTPIDSYAIIKQIYSAPLANLITYYLEGFNWTLNAMDDFEIENGKIVGIKALDYLYELMPTGGSHETSLIGTINISINGVTISETTLYNKYSQLYPNVVFKYDENNSGLIKAHKINFYNKSKAEFEEVDATPEFVATHTPILEAQTEGDKTLAELIEGQRLQPTKDSTTYYHYHFYGEWCDWNDPNKTSYFQEYAYREVFNNSEFPGWEGHVYYTFVNGIYQIYESQGWNEGTRLYERYEPVTAFNKVKPIKDMLLVPVFERQWRTYDILFKDGEDNIWGFAIGYGEKIGSATYPFTQFVYRPGYAPLQEYERRTFKGWYTQKDYENGTVNPTLIDLNDYTVTGDMVFYGHFVIEDARKVASDYKLFSIGSNNVSVNNESITATSISLFSDLAGQLQGKITIPSKDKNGNFITIINSFQGLESSDVEFYFQEDSMYNAVADNAFINSLVKNIYLPNDITIIGKSSFEKCPNLEMGVLPTELRTLGSRAFAESSNIMISTIPSGVTYIPLQCFASCHNLGITQLGGPEFAKLEIDNMAFIAAAQKVKELSILSPVTFVNNSLEGIFISNGYKDIESLTTYSLFGYVDESNFVKALFGTYPKNLKTITLLTGG